MPKHVPQASDEFNPFGELIGLSFSKLEEGSSQCQLEITDKLLNPYGVVHGGVIYSLADTAMAGALYSTMSEDERCMTIEMKVAYFQSANSGNLHCSAKIVHRGKRLGYLESEVTSEERLIAKASGTFSIFTN